MNRQIIAASGASLLSVEQNFGAEVEVLPVAVQLLPDHFSAGDLRRNWIPLITSQREVYGCGPEGHSRHHILKPAPANRRSGRLSQRRKEAPRSEDVRSSWMIGEIGRRTCGKALKTLGDLSQSAMGRRRPGGDEAITHAKPARSGDCYHCLQRGGREIRHY